MFERIRDEQLGELKATPTRFQVDSQQMFVLTYTVGKTPIVEGGRIRVMTPKQFSTPNMLQSSDYHTGWVPGYTMIEEQPEGVDLELVIEPPKFGFWLTADIVIRVLKGRLEEGQKVVLRYGGGVSKVRIAKIAGKTFAFRAVIDPDGAGQGPHGGYTFCSEDVALELTPGDPLRLEPYVKSTHKGGTPVPSVLAVRKDSFHNIVAADPIRVPSPGVEIESPGDDRVQRVEIRDDMSGLLRISNASVPEASDGLKLYWGDLHVHTRISDDGNAEGPDSACAFARDTMGHDFFAFADHVDNIRAEEWKETCAAAAQATKLGEFVALPGYEFNSRENPNRRRLDKNVLYLDPTDAPLHEGISRDDYRDTTSEDLLARMDMEKQMIIPHQHPGGIWDVKGLEKMRVVEIYSHWGCYENAETERPYAMGSYNSGALVSEALAAGVRFGFVAGSDNHTAHPGNDFLWPLGNYAGGLTAIWAKDLTPQGLFDAINSRSCYATTRARIWLKFFVNGACMGSEIKEGTSGSREITGEVHGSAPLAEVSLVRNGETVQRWTPKEWDCTVSFEDKNPPRRERGDFYYLKVVQEDTEMAWSSPVWIG